MLLHSAQPHVFDLNQRRLILQLTRWANCTMPQRTQQQQGENTFHVHSKFLDSSGRNHRTF